MRVVFRSLLLGYVIFGGAFLFAQDCEKCLATPQELKGYVSASLMEEIYNGRKDLAQLTYDYKNSEEKFNKWNVYSDRAENPLFSSPGGREAPRKLKFMEELYVLETQTPWLRVGAKEVTDGSLIFKELGWVRVENLLLTTHALLNEKSTTKKGLVLINLNNTEELKAMTAAMKGGKEIEKYMFYANPQHTIIRQQEKELEIRYVLKEVRGSKLLSENDRINGLSDEMRKNNVSGWMKRVNITNWDTRVCLERSYGAEYKEEYGNDVIPVFKKEADLKAYAELGIEKASEAIFRHFIEKERMGNYIMRMPILENYENSDYKAVATVGSVGGVSDSIASNKAKGKEIIEDLKTKRNNINILFVIDATSSMSDYFQAVNSGIEKIIALNKEKYKKRVKFGVAIYRDYADKNEVFDILPLTGEEQRVHNFLSGVRTYSAGTSHYESQYYGLIEGVKRSQMRPEQSNIVILIGDAGNHLEDEKMLQSTDVINSLDKYNASLITFQVVFGPKPSYSDFNLDAQDFLYGIGKESDTKGELKPVLVAVKTRKNAYELQFKDPESGVSRTYIEGGFGRFIHANDNEAMPIEELQKNLIDALGQYMTELDRQLIRFEQTPEKAQKKRNSDNYEEADFENLNGYLKEGGMTQEEINLFFSQHDAFSLKGYTSTRFYQKDLSCFQPVVFLSDSEVDGMLQVFNDIDDDATPANAKVQIYNGLMAQAKAALGEQSDERVKKLTLSEIWGILLGVPFDENNEYGTLKDIPLAEIPTSNHPMLPKFIVQFQHSVGLFTKSNLKEDQFKLHDEFYYWVPLRKIPGNG